MTSDGGLLFGPPCIMSILTTIKIDTSCIWTVRVHQRKTTLWNMTKLLPNIPLQFSWDTYGVGFCRRIAIVVWAWAEFRIMLSRRWWNSCVSVRCGINDVYCICQCSCEFRSFFSFRILYIPGRSVRTKSHQNECFHLHRSSHTTGFFRSDKMVPSNYLKFNPLG